NGSVNFTIACPGATSANPQPVTLTLATVTTIFNMNGGLNYKLCHDAPCTAVYANNTAGPSISVNTASPFTYTLYGNIPANQAPAPSAYNQTVYTTLTF